MGDKVSKEAILASHWNQKFKESMVAKAPETKKWDKYWDAYRGDYFRNKSKPDYKSDLVSNYVFSIIETIRPIMLDNNPKFQAMPRQPDALPYANDLQEVFSYEWDRERMNAKLSRDLITALVTGNTVYFLPWDGKSKNVKAVSVNPYNIFNDPLATSVEDSEYIIYATYQHQSVLKQAFPSHAKKLSGGQVNYGELVNNNNDNAKTENQILVLEVWTRDYESTEEDAQGVPKLKYPHGRVLNIAPELNLVLSDKPNPYKDGKFPFIVVKDYDIPGKFWGEGEVSQLISPQTYINELNNAIIDNAKTTANMPWIIDKNSGIAQGALTSRPGLVVRKNPGTEVRREQPAQMPQYVPNAVETFKQDMEQVSGVFDSIKGNSETGVYTAQGVLALQEAGQARIRLKVKVLESALGDLAEMWYSRIRQFWGDDRFIRITRMDGSYELKEFQREIKDFDYDIRILAGSTMPVNRGAMLDLMVRLAQTPMPDGQNIVDREAVVTYLPEEVKAPLMKRMAEEQGVMAQLQQQLQQVAEESQANDQSHTQLIEQLTGSVETLNKKILQVEEYGVKLEEEKKQAEEREKLRSEGYNQGYTDAEKLTMPEEGELTTGLGESTALEQKGLPDDILEGLESMSDDELALLIQSNPEIADLIQ